MLKDMKTVGVLLLLSAISAGTAYAVPKWGTAGVKEIQQNGVCNGVVTDTTGETVIGASVVVKGTTNGTITGLDGDFSLSGVTKGSILVVSFVGYQNTEVKWNGQPLTIVLKEDTKVLDEVVVVGYGTQKKANLSGAVAAVDGKVLQDRPITNIGQGLQGVVPNLNITMNNGGAPGATSSFNIRGNTSLNGGSPLVLVDNVQMDANLVNPDDIESISVLKDAASASIYGARAAYGVILITTKKGKPMPVKHPDGHYAGQGSYTNPVAIMEQGGNAQYKQNDLWMTGAVKITPIKGLVINADYTWNFYGKSSNQHVQNFYDYTAVPGTENYYPWTNPSSVTVTNNDDYYNAFNAFAEYTFSLKEKHNFKVMVGYNQENKHKKYHYAGRKNLIDSSNPSLNLAYGDMAMNGSETHWSVNGFFARINYDYKGKYLLELNGRYDGSSKFPHGDRYAFFPSASVAWRVSEEKFWEPIRGWFDNFKLRASYGSLGNQALDESRYGNFPYLATYGINTKYGALLNGTRPVAVSVPGLVSASFTWETVNQIDFGFDASFFGGRLNTSFDWYRRNTKDMLTAGQALPAVLGTSVPQENAADMKTVGWEVSLEWNDRLSNGFGYHIKGVLSDYQASITKFSNPTKLLGTHYVGEKLNEIWGYVSNGLFQSDEDAKAADQSYLSGGSWGAGDVKYEDLNNDGKIDIGKNTLDDSGDRKIIGNSTPRYSYGITAGFDYKGFDFEMFWQGIGKRDYWLGGSQFWGFTDEWCTPLTSSLDYWTEDNRDAYFPRLHHYGVNGGNHQVSTRYLQNAAYLRLKNVVLGYTIPRSITEKVKISRLRVFVQGENLLTFTPLIDSYDPETLNNMTYPINKKISVGLNLTF